MFRHLKGRIMQMSKVFPYSFFCGSNYNLLHQKRSSRFPASFSLNSSCCLIFSDDFTRFFLIFKALKKMLPINTQLVPANVVNLTPRKRETRDLRIEAPSSKRVQREGGSSSRLYYFYRNRISHFIYSFYYQHIMFIIK